jgi:hypothetical protein
MDPANSYFRATLSRRALLRIAAASVVPGRAFCDARLAGTVSALDGEAYAEGAGDRRNLDANSRIFIGDLVGTGMQSRVGLQLGQTQLRLGPDARVRIDTFVTNAGGVLELQSGSMVFDSGGKRMTRGLAVRSPFALIAVRGTHFFAGSSGGMFGVFVAHGRIRVTAARQTVELTDGMGTNIAYRGAPPTLPATWSSGRIQNSLDLTAFGTPAIF